MTTDEAPSGPAAPATRSHRVRNVVVIAAAFLVVLGAVTGGVLVFLAYDKATSIDRSTPQVVTDQFLEATLKLKDPSRVALFICAEWTAADAMAKVAAPSDHRVSASWGDPVTSITGATATVRLRVVFRVTSDAGIDQDPQLWTLRVEDRGGWRVCDVTKETSLNP